MRSLNVVVRPRASSHRIKGDLFMSGPSSPSRGRHRKQRERSYSTINRTIGAGLFVAGTAAVVSLSQASPALSASTPSEESAHGSLCNFGGGNTSSQNTNGNTFASSTTTGNTFGNTFAGNTVGNTFGRSTGNTSGQTTAGTTGTTGISTTTTTTTPPTT